MNSIKKILFIIFLSIPVISFSQISSISKINPKLAHVRKEYIKLVEEKDTVIPLNINISETSSEKKALNILGSYKDWNNEVKFVWLLFQDDVNTEFQNYFNKILPSKNENIEVNLNIKKFRLKQYMLTESQSCYFKYEYEFSFLKNGKKRNISFKEKTKIENINGPREIVDAIKSSLINSLIQLNQFITEK
ncbi:hypothetical protein [Wenyingzhuangia sp. IMCC45467]